MKFVPVNDLQPLMVVVFCGRDTANELWTVTAVDIENESVSFITSNFTAAVMPIISVAVPVIGTRPALRSKIINFFPSQNNTIPPPKPKVPESPIDRIMADLEKDKNLDMDSMLETHLKFVIDLVKDGEDMRLWNAAEKMREIHQQLGNLYIQSV